MVTNPEIFDRTKRYAYYFRAILAANNILLNHIQHYPIVTIVAKMHQRNAASQQAMVTLCKLSY